MEDKKNCFEFLDEWAAGKKREQDLDVINNPNKMIRKFGLGPQGTKCKTCVSLIHVDGGSKYYIKCKKYGVTHGAGTDWRQKWTSCSKYEPNESVRPDENQKEIE